MITLGIADDHSLIVSGLTHMLSEETGVRILFTAHSGAEVKAALRQQVPDVLLLDIELPDINGIELCTEISARYPQLPVVALTNHDEIVYVRKMMRGGAKGYLLKGTDKQTLLRAIRTVKGGEQFIDSQIEQAILQHTIMGKKPVGQIRLTSREKEILTLIAHEFSNQEIADKLFLSIRTVESHRHSLNQKLNIKNPAGLVKEAYLRGLIS